MWGSQALWEWGFVERVSSGLLLMQLGHEEGDLYLSIADETAVPEREPPVWSGAT